MAANPPRSEGGSLAQLHAEALGVGALTVLLLLLALSQDEFDPDRQMQGLYFLLFLAGTEALIWGATLKKGGLIAAVAVNALNLALHAYLWVAPRGDGIEPGWTAENVAVSGFIIVGTWRTRRMDEPLT